MGIMSKLGEMYRAYKSESMVKSILYDEAKRNGFRKMGYGYFGEERDTLAIHWKVGKEGGLEFDDEIFVGVDYLKRLAELYQLRPDLVRKVTKRVVHENNHRTGYSAANIAGKMVGHSKAFYSENRLPLKTDRQYLQELMDSPYFQRVCDVQANIQTLVERLDEPGMTVEGLKDEIAASLWVVVGLGDRLTKNLGTYSKDSVMKIINYNYPWLKSRDILERIDKMDEQYYEMLLQKETEPRSISERMREREKSVRYREEVWTKPCTREDETVIKNPQFFI